MDIIFGSSHEFGDGDESTVDFAMLSDDVCAQIQGYMDHLPTYLDPPQASAYPQASFG